MTINVSGAFVLGVLSTLMARLDAHHPARLAALVGFLGGYRTISTFAPESFIMWEKGEMGRSIGYMAGSVAGGFAAVVLGVALARGLMGRADQRGAMLGAGGAGDAAAGEGDEELAETA